MSRQIVIWFLTEFQKFLGLGFGGSFVGSGTHKSINNGFRNNIAAELWVTFFRLILVDCKHDCHKVRRSVYIDLCGMSTSTTMRYLCWICQLLDPKMTLTWTLFGHSIHSFRCASECIPYFSCSILKYV